MDAGEELVNAKMARLRQSLKGKAFEAIRSLGVSEAEYIEAYGEPFVPKLKIVHVKYIG